MGSSRALVWLFWKVRRRRSLCGRTRHGASLDRWWNRSPWGRSNLLDRHSGECAGFCGIISVDLRENAFGNPKYIGRQWSIRGISEHLNAQHPALNAQRSMFYKPGACGCFVKRPESGRRCTTPHSTRTFAARQYSGCRS